jgi:2'-5' RNA ligase
MPAIESALVVLVPEAERLVKPFRDRYDPAAAIGVPAHITLLYPFKPPDEIGPALLDDLGRGFARFAGFRFSLAHVRRFPAEVLYLAPEPDEPFRQLTSAIWDWYPETPPYGGQWPEVIPHLTVASLRDEKELDRVADEFKRVAQPMLPIDATAQDIALMDNRSGRWHVRTTLGLGGASG